MILVLDVGNTQVKLGLFKGGRLVRLERYGSGDRTAILLMAGSHPVEAVVIGSVAMSDPELVARLNGIAPVFEVMGNSVAPISNVYGTPETLGADRLANAVAAAALFPTRAVLVVDAGTCITYDLVDAAGAYLGGAIAPGLHLRAQAMHDYSERLPLVDLDRSLAEPFASSTAGSLLSGVLLGTYLEMAGFVKIFRERHPEGGVVITGGDGLKSANALKSGIFAHPYLTLEGYRLIYLHHRNRTVQHQP